MWNRPSLLTALTIVCFEATSAQIFVDQQHSNANDDNPGTEMAPLLTIQRAANLATPGDVVLVKSGVYTELNYDIPSSNIAAIKPQNSGTAEAPITYSVAPGHQVVIDQQDQGAGFYLFRRNHIVIRNFEIRNVRKAGIWTAVDGSTHIRAEGNYIHDVDDGPGTNVGAIKFDGCANCTALNNRLERIRVNGDPLDPNSAGVHSYDMWNTLISGNSISDTYNGIFHKRASGRPGMEFQNNLIVDVKNGVLLSVGGVGDPAHIDTRIAGNVIRRCEVGVSATVAETNEESRGMKIENNSIHCQQAGVRLHGISDVTISANAIGGSGLALMTVFDSNRAVANLSASSNAYAMGLLFRSNAFGPADQVHSNLAQWQLSSGEDSDSRQSDGIFRSEPNPMLWLDLVSSARNFDALQGQNAGAHSSEDQLIGASPFSVPPAPLNLEAEFE